MSGIIAEFGQFTVPCWRSVFPSASTQWARD